MAWDDYEVFCCVAEHGGFSAAARALDRPKSTLSAAVSRLEEVLDVRLFERTTRTLHLTEAGDALYSRIAPLFKQLDEARNIAVAYSHRISGTLRIAAPYEFSAHHLGACVCDIMARHPGLTIQIDMEYAQISPLDERYDIVFSMTDHALPSSGVVARRVISLEQGVFASPDFAAAYEMPSTPAQLSRLPVLTTARESDWTFFDRSGNPQTVPLLMHRLRSFNANIRLQAAIAGLGISRITASYCEEAVRTGRLLRVLPDYRCAPHTVYALFSSRRLMPTKMRVFLDTLEEMA